MPNHNAPAAMLAVLALRSVIDDGNWLAQTMLQFLGTSPAPWTIDSEIGDLSKDCLGTQPALHYQRYDMEFSASWMNQVLGEQIPLQTIQRLAAMDEPAMVPELLRHARQAAARQIRPDHLPPGFDVPPIPATD
jgi:hypothetical protein